VSKSEPELSGSGTEEVPNDGIQEGENLLRQQEVFLIFQAVF
jgi:hypothetical protein